MRQRPAVLLDRDGVINEDSNEYVKSWDEYHIYPGVLDALRRLHEAGCEVYIVTNQAGVGRGIYPYRNLLDILLRLRLTVSQAGGLIHGVAFCCHSKEAGCWCRKPQPGMLHTLAVKYGLDLSRSILVGDSCTDIQAGQKVGCTTILLQTRGPEGTLEQLKQCLPQPDYQAESLLEATEYILAMPQFAPTANQAPTASN